MSSLFLLNDFTLTSSYIMEFQERNLCKLMHDFKEAMYNL